MPEAASLPAVLNLLGQPLRVGEPDVAGALAVFPLFGAEPRLEYVSFAEGAARGVTVSELEGGASVNDLLVHNPLELPVLLYEGEELIGAQQNRTVDAAVLVPAASKLQVPVSCVEHGRWDGSRHREAFSPSAQAAYPELRAAKSARMRERMAAGGPARADQSEVWQAISHKAARHEAAAPTEAMSDVFASRRERLEELQGAINRRDGQLGALAAIAGGIAVLDCVSRPDVFAALHAPLVAGYALDALEHEDCAAPSREEAEAFVAGVLSAAPAFAPSVGAGRALRFEGASVAGTGLEVDGELVQLSAFAGERPRTRISRPSRRR